MALLSVLEVFRGPLAILLENMTRFLLRSRQLMAASILLLLAGVVVLSAATRRPCLQECTGGWHTWKAGYMAKPEGREACKLCVTAGAQAAQTASEVPLPSLPSINQPHQETIPPLVSLVVPILHFRSPPGVS